MDLGCYGRGAQSEKLSTGLEGQASWRRISKLDAVGQMTFETRGVGKVFRQIDHRGQDLEVAKKAGLVHENASSYSLCFSEINIAAVC